MALLFSIKEKTNWHLIKDKLMIISYFLDLKLENRNKMNLRLFFMQIYTHSASFQKLRCYFSGLFYVEEWFCWFLKHEHGGRVIGTFASNILFFQFRDIMEDMWFGNIPSGARCKKVLVFRRLYVNSLKDIWEILL